MKNRKWAIVFDFVSLLVVLVTNALAVSLPLNDLTTKQISDSVGIYFVPAGYVFLIWGVIYTQIIVFTIYRALPAQRNNRELAAIDVWLIVANLANALWLFSFHYRRFLLALFFMLVLLSMLIVIFLKLKIGKRRSSITWRWIVEAPFSVYLGWVSVATIANATQVLDYMKWNGWGIAPDIWFMVMVAAIVVISALMSFSRRAFEFNLVLIWALVGIAVKFPDVHTVNYSAWAGAILIAVIGMVALAVPIPMAKED